MTGVADLRMGLDRVAFARACGLEPDVWQMRLLRSENPRVIINAARQSGKSTVTALLALHQALYTSNSLVLVLAPALRQSQEFFSKLSDFHAALGTPKRKYGERRLSLELSNGSRVISLPGAEKTIRGFSGAALIILDEASRIEDELLCREADVGS
jgi:phage terminase large subunit-like protein